MGRTIWCAAAAMLFGCAQKEAPFSIDTGPGEARDSETARDTGSDTAADTGETDRPGGDSDTVRGDSEREDTGADTASDSDRESDTERSTERALGVLGEPCWIPPLSDRHPNAALPGCESGLRCVGDSDEAWCTERCERTGAVSEEAPTIGWCCGEVGSACNPSRYLMPQTMSDECVPRNLSLGASCENGGALRCASVCDGTETVAVAVCAQLEEGGICSFGCDDHTECTVHDAFASGCCGDAMGSSYCLPETSDRCLSGP